MLTTILVTLLVLSLIVWVGGAITGQIWMFRAGQQGDLNTRVVLLPQILWIIRRVYIPMAATAFTSGLLLAWRAGVSWTAPWLLFPVIVFIATVVVGSLYSLPEYSRLVALLGHRSASDPELQRRIEIAAWVNRVELGLVLIGVVGVIVQAVNLLV